MSKNKLFFHQSSLSKDEIDAVKQVIESGWLTTGIKTQQFENIIKEYIGIDNVVALSSCTAALALGIRSLGVRPGDEVITSPFTYVATVAEIIHARAKPVFVDVKESNGNMDEDLIEEAITSKTKLFLPVHFAGHPCNMSKINEVKEKYKIPVLEDAAHALEASWDNQKIGTISEGTCFSFYATKNITCGEGGAFVTSDKKLADKVRLLSQHGISNQVWDRDNDSDMLYAVEDMGYKYNLPDILSVIGIEQMKKIEQFKLKRKLLWEEYDNLLFDVDEIKTPMIEDNCVHARHLYVIVLKDEIKNKRPQIRRYLKEKGIDTSIHFHSLHLHPYFQKRKEYQGLDLPVAEKLSSSVISLPLFPLMDISDVKKVIDFLKDAINTR